MRRLLLLAAGALCLTAAEEVPGWVREAAARPLPKLPERAPAVILFQEEVLTVDAEGRRVIQERSVVRKLSSGSLGLSAIRAYNVKTGRIRDIRAWTLEPGGREVRHGKDRIVETALDRDALFDEARIKKIDAGTELPAGSVFAYEITEEEKTVFTQYSYSFQGTLPVLVSRFVLQLPSGWEANGRVFNRSEGDGYTASGATHTWELRDLPWQEREPYRPSMHLLAPRLALTYFPGSGASAALRPLRDWAAVSQWMTVLADPQGVQTPEIQAKAAQLTAAASTPIDKIRAIASHVQQTTYISVQMNLTRGGGYTPHPAADVLRKNYGDCKDKANLMKALLAAAGIDSYLVAIFSGARDFVRPEWPSTLQFNHMILAVRVPENAKFSPVVDHPELGRILFFDPTDPHTPLGDLPDDEQGSHALVIAGDKGALVAVPRAPAHANRYVSRTEAIMNPEGGVSAKTEREYYGQAARGMRSLLREEDGRTVRRSFEYMLTRKMGGLTLDSVKPDDDLSAGVLRVGLAFQAHQLGKLMQNRLLIFAPGALLSGGVPLFPSAERRYPVKLEAERREDSVRITVPEGFVIDELPDPVSLKSELGAYKGSWKMDGQTVVFEQALELRDATVAPSDYATVRRFFEQVGGSASAAVVLLRK